jgi:glycosyltransferase involved in cell wall biosynthesis
MKEKKVSVILPVYGVEQYIAEAVRSVLAQTYGNFELLIVDDGSPDRSIEICQQFIDPRIQIIQQKNRGLSGARNTGIRHAQGEYLAFLDGDDLWTPEKLERHVAHLDNSPEVGLSFSRSAFIDEQGKDLNTYQMPKLTGITADYLLCCNPVGNGSAPVVRREVFKSIGRKNAEIETCYFDESLRRAEDIECWLRIAIQTPWLIEGIPEPLTLYRVNAGSLSASLLQQLASWEAMVEKTRSYAPELIARGESIARAYQLLYLARTAVRLQLRDLAVSLTHQAMVTHPPILFKEPRRTLLTLIAAYLLRLLPSTFFNQVNTLTTGISGIFQRRRIVQDSLP